MICLRGHLLSNSMSRFANPFRIGRGFRGCDQLLDGRSAADSCMGTIASPPSCNALAYRAGGVVAFNLPQSRRAGQHRRIVR